MSDLDRKLAEALGLELHEVSHIPHIRMGKLWVCPLADLSTTWDGGGLVVEAMRERGFYLTLTQRPNSGWRAYYRRHVSDPPGLGDLTEAPTAPEAIAKAALAALEQTDE